MQQIVTTNCEIQSLFGSACKPRLQQVVKFNQKENAVIYTKDREKTKIYKANELN